MAPNPYPNLGFNPVEGLPADVEETLTSISSAATVVGDASKVLDRLADSNDAAWRGEAGDAFRAHLDQTLTADLRMANRALEDALRLLERWRADLASMTETARQLEREAAEARGELAAAESGLERARANPDLGLANVVFTTGEELRVAQERLDAATNMVDRANGRVTELAASLEAILRRARELQGECESNAGRVAAELTAIASRYAPREPDKSMLERLGAVVDDIKAWYGDNKDEIHQALSTVSAASGVLAFVTPPPINLIAAGVSVVTGAGVLAMDLSDPDVQDGMGQLLRGNLNGDSLTALGTLGLDTLGVLPGVGLARASADGVGGAVAALDTGGSVAQGVARAMPGVRAPLESMGELGRHAATEQVPDALKAVGDKVVTVLTVNSAVGEYDR